MVYELDLYKLSVKELSRAGRMITNPNKITFMFDPTKSKNGPPPQMYIQPANGTPGTQCLLAYDISCRDLILNVKVIVEMICMVQNNLKVKSRGNPLVGN